MFRAAFACRCRCCWRRSPLPAPAAGRGTRRNRATGENCQQQKRAPAGGAGAASAASLGGIAGGSPSAAPVGAVSSVLPVGSLLGEAIASLLDCREQQQAATATEQAVRGGVGTTADAGRARPAPTSAARRPSPPAKPTAADGQCMTVTDIVIIDGEETRAPKRMCRRPPNNRYVRV